MDDCEFTKSLLLIILAGAQSAPHFCRNYYTSRQSLEQKTDATKMPQGSFEPVAKLQVFALRPRFPLEGTCGSLNSFAPLHLVRKMPGG